MAESKILILYCGGTLGMVRHPTQGYVPYPGFLTETLRTQSRFHDPYSDSIFSWSDTTERYKAWSETYSRPASGSNTPNRPTSPTSHPSHNDGRQSHIHLQHGTTNAASATPPATHFQAFCPPIAVLSSDPHATFTKNAVSHRIDAKGRLELLLPTMMTPSANNRRVRYTVLEYDPLLDSSNIETKDWLRLATDIGLNYRSFDAFVILHGTDTMCYTSSALSMLLENIGKPIILTGAQVPLSELRNDAIENVLGALILASQHPIAEVTLFFSSKLFRGNRVSKLSNATLDAFDSPNIPPLATAGITIQINHSMIIKPRLLQPFRAHDKMSQQVVLLRLFPGLQIETIANFFSEPIEGVILHSFGAGNAPNKPELLEVFRKATQERDVVIVNISQCIRGEVSAIYQVGKQLQSVGVVAGGDMTPECALTKLSYLLAKKDLTRDQIRKLMGQSLRGELTERRRNLAMEADSDEDLNGGQARRLLEYVVEQDGGHAANVHADMDELALSAEKSLLPFFIQRACMQMDQASLQTLLTRQTKLENLPALSLTKPDASGRDHLSHAILPTSLALHIAAARGHTEQVRSLLASGFLVHARDYAGHTPLFLAARNEHLRTIDVLCSAGAHLSTEEEEMATLLLQRRIEVSQKDSRKPDLEPFFQIWHAAGVDTISHRISHQL